MNILNLFLNLHDNFFPVRCIFWIRGNISCKFHDFCPIVCGGQGKNYQNMTIVYNLFTPTHHSVRKTEFKIMQTRKLSTKIVNFISPGEGDCTNGLGQNDYVVLTYLMLKILFFTTDNTEQRLFAYQESQKNHPCQKLFLTRTNYMYMYKGLYQAFEFQANSDSRLGPTWSCSDAIYIMFINPLLYLF